MGLGKDAVQQPGQGSKAFRLWQPGPIDALRSYLVSENFQSATQLAVGVLFVSLFVFVDALRFPGSCVAVLLYFVVAVTAAVDCHVGTRIFLCGFMVGPMWLSLLLGGVIATLGKLAPSREGQLIVLCVLGPLALIPFCINRVGTSHIFLWAMGMVSCLYLGMPILNGWAAPDISTLWARAVGFVLVAALIGMFAGSVLSMIVLPSLASHKVEDEVSAALKKLGHHLSTSASQLWRPGKSSLEALPRHLEGLHPLLLNTTDMAEPGLVAPGVLDRDLGAAQVSPRQVYVAAMDWLEHLSRPPSDPTGRTKSACFPACTSGPSAEDARSELHKSTFYGAAASSMAAAVAAAVEDAESNEQWLEQHGDMHSNVQGWSCTDQGPGHKRLHSTRADSAAHDPTQLRLGSTITAASVDAAKAEAEAVRAAHLRSIGEGYPTGGAEGCLPGGLRSNSCSVTQPVPTISEVRQLLAHATQLLDAAAAEPQWLRGGERRFVVKAWRPLVAAVQLVALRLTALDLIQRDFVSLSEETHSFPVAEELSQLLKQLYGSAAAALALLSEQIRCREQFTHTCAASQQILKHPEWCGARQRLLSLLEGTLAAYYLRLQEASPDNPVTIPSAHWVRRWMFFHTTTLSVIDALDGLSKASEAALTPPQQHGHWWNLWKQPQQQQQQQQQSSQPPPQCGSGSTCKESDMEAGVAGNVGRAAGSSPARTTELAAMSGGTFSTAGGVGDSDGETRPPGGGATQQQRQQQQQHTGRGQGDGTAVSHQPLPALLDSLTSVRLTGSDAEPVSAAIAAADAAAATPDPPAAGPPWTSSKQKHQQQVALHQQQQQRQQQQGPVLPATKLPSPAAAHAAGGSSKRQGFKASWLRQTAWVRPWLPLALNMKQVESLHEFATKDLPAAFSSKQAFITALHNRRVHAAVKYWFVLVVMLVGTLLLQYFVPASVQLGPSFGYTAAVVGMSDRVESTVFKVITWTSATILGAFLGWALMVHPSIALNSAALGTVMCVVAFCVGNLERGPDKGRSVFTLYTLTTLASIVLCQCCSHVGSTLVSVTRGASVMAAGVIAVAVQNLVLPWYTSTWALQQIGEVFKEATEVLADLVCQLYEETEELMQQQQDPGLMQAQQGDGLPAAAGDARDGAPAAMLSPAQRLQLLDAAVGRVWLKEQQALNGVQGTGPGQQQPQQQRQPSFTSRVASVRLASIGRMFASSSELRQPPGDRAHSSTGQAAGPVGRDAAGRAGPLDADAAGPSPGVTGHTAERSHPAVRVAGVSNAPAGPDVPGDAAAAAVLTALATGQGPESRASLTEMVQLLQQRRLKHQQQQQQGSAPGRVKVTGLQLQARLVRPLVQVKISLLLDTTAWRSGPLATPALVVHMVGAMFDLVDALAALQQAVAVPVKQLSGSWDWTLIHIAGAWAALLLEAMQLADATAAHALTPTAESRERLLSQVQELQHKRFEYFAVHRELRRLLHTAMAVDEELSPERFVEVQEWQLQGHLRYAACVYASGKVLDRITAAARCALNKYN